MAQSMTNAVTGSYEDVVSRFFDPVRSASTRFPAGEKGNQVKIGTPGISRERERERKKKGKENNNTPVSSLSNETSRGAAERV